MESPNATYARFASDATLEGVLSIDLGGSARPSGGTRWADTPSRNNPKGRYDGLVETSTNAAQFLMNTVYLKILDPTKQDEFFAATAGSVFHAMMSGTGEPAAIVDALAQSAREGRLLVWSAHKQEQALLSGTVLSGRLVGAEGDSPVIGVYLNDGTAAKIGYYLRTAVAAPPTGCHPDSSQTVTVKVTLTNTAPAVPLTCRPTLPRATPSPRARYARTCCSTRPREVVSTTCA